MAFQGDSIFWVDTEKVVPNPFQPRREFDQSKLQELAESIRMYGVLQPLTVTRAEVQRGDGTFYTEYELIAGERRLRASCLAGVAQVPVIIREGEQNEQEKLELAIIENLQREDLNAIDRALAFQQLAEQFKLSHTHVAQKVGRSREYVSNSIRLLALPDHIKSALQRGDLGEGHARTLLMLSDRPQEQETIFREILLKKMSVREVERIVRKIATDKVRKQNHEDIGAHLIEIEKEFTETLGTRVQIQKTDFGGKLTIDYFSEDDLAALLKRMQAETTDPSLNAAATAMATVAAATPLISVVDQALALQSADEQKWCEPGQAETAISQSVSPEKLAAKVSSFISPAPESHPVSESSIPTRAEEPVKPQPATVPTIEQPATPNVDPSLLARLVAHTSFGFIRPDPMPQQLPVRPETPPTTELIAAPEQPPISTHPTLERSNETSPQSVEQPAPESAAFEVVAPKDESEDIYSIHNFSI